MNHTLKRELQQRRTKMTAALDRAMEAAHREGRAAVLANLIEARGSSIDAVNLDAAAHSGAPWGPVHNPADGKRWFVAGADPLVPACLARVKQATLFHGGGEHGVLRSISWFVANNGGPLVEIGGKAMTAAVCPDLKGQITGKAAVAGFVGVHALACPAGHACHPRHAKA